MSAAVPARTPSTTASHQPAATTRAWWLADRDPAIIAVFRLASGAALTLHFGSLWREAPRTLVRTGLFEAAFLDNGWPEAWSGHESSVARTVLGTGLVLSLALAWGFRPRLCAAAIYLVLLFVHRALWPAANLSDYVAGIAALVLALVPQGGAPHVWQGFRRTRVTRPDVRTPAIALSLFLMGVLVFYTTGLGGSGSEVHGFEGRFVAVALPLIPVMYVLPGKAFAWLGLGLQGALHATLLISTGAIVENLILGATAVLFLGEVPRASSRVIRLDAGSAVAVVLASAVAIGTIGTAFSGASPPGVQFLKHLALLPPTAPHSGGEGSLGVRFERQAESETAAAIHSVASERERLLVIRLLHDERSAQYARSHLAPALARRACRDERYAGQAGSVVLVNGDVRRTILEFACGHEPEAAGSKLTASRFRVLQPGLPSP